MCLNFVMMALGSPQKLKKDRTVKIDHPMIQKIEQQIAGEMIRARFYSAQPDSKADWVYIHGAGKLGLLEFPYSAEFERKGFSVLNFHFSGCGQSSGNFENSSLSKRVAEARAMIESHVDSENFKICAASMGGHIALRMLQYFQPKSLILFCPAIYDRDAFELPFGSGFSQAIRKPFSWKNSETLELLRNFNGQLLIFIGSDDQVIPKGVIELLDHNSPNASPKEIITLSGCPHNIYLWLEQHPQQRQTVINKILDFSFKKSP